MGKNPTKKRLKVSVEEIEEAVGKIQSDDSPKGLIGSEDHFQSFQDDLRAFHGQSLAETIIDSLPGIFFILNVHGTLIRWNQRLENVTGYSSDELSGIKGERLIASIESEVNTKKSLKRILKARQIDKEVYLVLKNRYKKPYHLTGSRITVEKKPYVIITGIDITEKKKAEELLKESEERFRALFENSTDFVYTLDLKGNFTSANKAAERLTGFSGSKLLTMNFKDYTAEEDHEKVFLAFNRVFTTGEPLQDFPLEVTVKNGVKKYFELSVALLKKGEEIIGFQGSSRDITERKHAEDELRESEERFKTLFEFAPDAYYLIDMKGHLADINKVALNMLGFQKEEILGRSYQELNIFSSVQLPKVSRFIKSISRTQSTGPNYLTVIRKDGKQIEIEAMNHLIKIRGQNYVLGIARDVSERKRLEAQLFQAQKLESVGTLAGGIAHNFNNLLMGIQGNASIILLTMGSNNPYYKHLKNIETLVKNGSKLTNQLLEYARGGRFEIIPITLNDLVREIADTFGAAKKDVRIHFALAEDLFSIKADQGQIEQTLLNLYVNAADAMPEGGELFLETKNVTDLDMHNKPYTPKPGHYVMLIVKDTGVGMDKVTKERIFEPFFTTKGLARGTGLGLASVYGVVKGHGGYIDVESEKGYGATFNIFLPAVKDERIERSRLSGHVVEGDETILFVDDEAMVLDTGQQMLQKLGYDVFVAKSGHEALEICKKYRGKIHLVLLDMVMPDLGGGETFDKMRNIDPSIKVLLSSGYGIDGQASEILKRGCHGFIQKPFNINELSQKIRQILDEKESNLS